MADNGYIYRNADSEFFIETDDDVAEGREENLLGESESTEEMSTILDEMEEAGKNMLKPTEFGLRGDKAKNIYCDKNELYEEIRKYQKDGKPTDALGEMLIKIALHMSTMARFWRYSHDIKEELVDNAIIQMLKSVPKFNLKDSKKNPFGYLSMICYRDMLHTLKKHFKQDKIRDSIINAKISRLAGDNPADERLAMLRSTLERNEEYSNFMKNDRYPCPPKQVDTFALSKKEQMRRSRMEAKKGTKSSTKPKKAVLTVVENRR